MVANDKRLYSAGFQPISSLGIVSHRNYLLQVEATEVKCKAARKDLDEHWRPRSAKSNARSFGATQRLGGGGGAYY